MNDMKIEMLAVEALIPYAMNSRTHGDEQIAQIAVSIREFGFNNPVLVDEIGTIIAGHGRVMAAQRLGMETIPCIRLLHLTPSQRRAYVIADNRTSELSGWDTGLLARELEELNEEGIDIDALGFDSESIEHLLGDDFASSLFGAESDDENETEEPTADDYRDIGDGVVSDSKGSAILFPVMIQLRKADYNRWKAFRGRRPQDAALNELLDIEAHYRAAWAEEKALREAMAQEEPQ